MAIKAAKPAGINELAESLQTVLGKMVLVVSSLDEPAFCMSFRARAIGIEVSPDAKAMTLHFSASDALIIPCEGVVSAAGFSERRGQPAYWVELQLPLGPTVMIEEVPSQKILAPVAGSP